MEEFKEILKLSTAERVLLVEKIWDSVSHEEVDITELQKKELDQRLSRFKEGKTKFYSWEKLKKS